MDNEKSLEELITNSLNNIENFESEISDSSSESSEEIRKVSSKGKKVITQPLIRKHSKKHSKKRMMFHLSPESIYVLKITLLLLGIYLALTSKTFIDLNIKLMKYEDDNYKCMIIRAVIYFIFTFIILKTIIKSS